MNSQTNSKILGVAKRLATAFWFGGGAFLMAVAAPAAFKNAGDARAAAAIVGAMLTPWHYIALFVPLFLLALEMQRPRWMQSVRMALLSVILLFAAAQVIADLKIRNIRRKSATAIGSLDRNNPVRRQFGMLHGISSMLMLGQLLLGVGVVALDDGRQETASSRPDETPTRI